MNSNTHLPFEIGIWDIARQHCELDTLLTAIALVERRRIQGNPCLHIPEAKFALIEGYLRQRPYPRHRQFGRLNIGGLMRGCYFPAAIAAEIIARCEGYDRQARRDNEQNVPF